jgi:hypothetical protein
MSFESLIKNLNMKFMNEQKFDQSMIDEKLVQYTIHIKKCVLVLNKFEFLDFIERKYIQR